MSVSYLSSFKVFSGIDVKIQKISKWKNQNEKICELLEKFLCFIVEFYVYSNLLIHCGENVKLYKKFHASL